MGQFDLDAILVADRAELHVHVRQLRERFAVARQGGAAQGEEPFLRFGEDVRLETAQFFQPGSPRRQKRVGQESREQIVADGLDFGSHESAGLVDAREQVLELPHAREVIGVAAVLGVLERGVPV